MYSAKNIVGLLDQNIERVVRHLLPNGKNKSGEWCIGSINCEAGDSLKVCLQGDKKGVWCDFATGESGDLINLWCLCRNKTISEAISEVKQWLGIPSTIFEPQRRSQFVRPEIKNEVPIQQASSICNYLMSERKLTLETLKAYQIRETKNEIVFPFYIDGKLNLLKYLQVDRPQGKKQIRVTPNSEPCLFGWQAIPENARAAVLVEGEIDAMSLFQFGLNMAVLSVPFGGGKGGKHQWLEYEFDRLAVFDEIYLCLDNDAEGQAATNELIERLGRHRCRVVQLPLKDANECLQAGISSEQIRTCFENAKILDPDELKAASLYVDQVIDEFYPSENQPMGYALPWQKAGDKIYLRPSELSIWTGINGHGKSQLLGQVMLHCMKQGAKVCIASLELKPKRLLMRLTRQASGLRKPSEAYIRAIHEWYENNLWIFDLVGSAKANRLLEVFQYARQRYGIDVFVIDSLMKCGMPEDDYNAQKSLIEKLCDFKNVHDCHIHLVAHPRKPQDENKVPGKLDMKGTGTITDLADNCFSTWRNKLKEDELNKPGNRVQPPDSILEKYDCLFTCDKQRNGEWEGKLALWFNPDSFQYLENRHLKPIQMVPFSNRSQLGRQDDK
ncbi:MAG: toprim domain-containing protein [Gammaproteobacteria bacterium]|nr:toprim domain-containing protein [Gammaproteobacteria bacterium]